MKTKNSMPTKRPDKGVAKPLKTVPPGTDKNQNHSEPEQFCVCPACRKRINQPEGTLCSIIRCPECGAHMIREWF